VPEITIAETTILPGTRRRVEIPVARLPTETWMSILVDVINGSAPGPCLWLSAAIHGDELNGVEIIRRVLGGLESTDLKGCLISVPIVNVFGFMEQDRYLPDRRDLNRSFPGSRTGSLAARLANLFMTEVVSHCSHGIDLHTGSHHRANLPQIRGNFHDAETRRCAEAFQAPVMMHSQTRDGSLRHAATARGIHVLLYEAGESMRFDDRAIEIGTQGVLQVMTALRMIRSPRRPKQHAACVVTEQSLWIRARRGGILRLNVELGQHVEHKERIGVISDAFGENKVAVAAPGDGIVIGVTRNPLVHQGDAIVHLAQVATSIPNSASASEAGARG
jgi:uncharacterized protein